MTIYRDLKNQDFGPEPVRDRGKIFQMFNDIIRGNKESSVYIDKIEWWKYRKSLDNKMKDLIDCLENIIGISRYMFYGLINDSKIDETLNDMCMLITELGFKSKINFKASILKSLTCLPWESIKFLTKQQIYRQPCNSNLIVSLLKANMTLNCLNFNNSFYMVNLTGDLKATQEMFEPWFKLLGWKGLCNTAPSNEQFLKAITQFELFVYCGHGAGNAYIKKDELSQAEGKAVSCLMGCSTGYLQSNGLFEPYGVLLNYLMAGCPTVIANLWDVTSRDLDRYFKNLLENWIESPSSSLGIIVQKSRFVCKLPYMVGSSPIVYGLPCVLDETTLNVPSIEK
ncbi:uncharacterized protein LOC135930200 [Gordionus sp. m RMFG-2023]|uniref:uncharacterized protein LOC135930200 n=1 Tax=Gordionus sp. m RMFG-2023 TaxID=3053472 RepID=UPI0031FC7413